MPDLRMLPLLLLGGLAVGETLPAANTLSTFDAPDADQGVAVDAEHFYAIDNSVIAKHSRDSGELVKRWDGGAGSPLEHMNSCIVLDTVLECANSNYSTTPMASSVEWFDTETLEHRKSHSLGLTDEGSITWTDKIATGRIAGFAHYSKPGGEPFKGSAYSSVVLFDDAWRRTGGYAFPLALIEEMAPYAASGGAIGPDGFLYILGHDLPRMYVLAKPRMGPYLIHIATIGLEAEGQAFSFENNSRRVWVIDRRKGKVRRIELPAILAPGGVDQFR